MHEVRAKKLTEATIILVLISSNLLAQDDFLDGFLKQAMQRQRDGAVLIPIIGRPTLWQDTPLGRLRVLRPTGDRWSRYREQIASRPSLTLPGHRECRQSARFSDPKPRASAAHQARV